MKLLNAHYCPDCGEIFDPSNNDYRRKYTCPSCTNRLTVEMISFFKAKPEQTNVHHINLIPSCGTSAQVAP
jgi:DNA-directed RNA polymerase subunit M/transcription elongation factor TFIIS